MECGCVYTVMDFLSPQDVLLNDSIKLDWTFRLSLLTDVAKVTRHPLPLYWLLDPHCVHVVHPDFSDPV